MRRFAVLAAFVLAAAMLAGSSPEKGGKVEPVKRENVTWHYMVSLDFVPGEYEAAVELIHKHFMPAGKAANLETGMVFMCATGEWDMTMIFPLPHGPGELEWEVSPDDARWINALAERMGGMEKAEKALKKFGAMIDRAEGTLMWQQMPKKAH